MGLQTMQTAQGSPRTVIVRRDGAGDAVRRRSRAVAIRLCYRILEGLMDRLPGALLLQHVAHVERAS